MPTPRTLYAKSGNVHLAYQTIGDGPRDVVLVLDWASHLEAVWEQPFIQEFIGSLNRYARVLWFDMRGVGLSDRIVEQAGATEDWMEDVVAVMDAAGSERATLIRECLPRLSKTMPEPATRSRTVLVTSTSPGAAADETRAPKGVSESWELYAASG